MSNFTSTLIGFYQYDTTLFDEIMLPDGIDHDTLVNVIMMECGEFQPLWTDYTFYKSAINQFFKKWNQTFTKWQEALSIEYEPLYNYDRYEEYTDTFSETRTGSSSETTSGSNQTTNSGSSTNTHTKSAFDSSTYEPYEKTEITDSESGTATSSGTSSGTTRGTNENELQHDAHLYGNIGITSSQDMLRQQLDIVEWNIYQHICDLFAAELCISLY